MASLGPNFLTNHRWVPLITDQWCGATICFVVGPKHCSNQVAGHNGHDSVSNHQPHACLINRLFRRRSKKTPKPRVTGLCAGNSPGNGEFPAQMASNAENVSIWWRHHGIVMYWWLSQLLLYKRKLCTDIMGNVDSCIGLASSHFLNQCQSFCKWTIWLIFSKHGIKMQSFSFKKFIWKGSLHKVGFNFCRP